MGLSKREKNEREFEHWEDLPDGSRQYWFDVIGKSGGRARYIKYVDSTEAITSFAQEIYDNAGIMPDIHEKYPVDKGYKK